MPGRSAAGLHRAGRLGIELLRTDDELLEAIRLHLAGKAKRADGTSAQPSRHGTLATLRMQRDKLLQTYLAYQISPALFAEQKKVLTAKINTIEAECSEAVEAERKPNALAEAFERGSDLAVRSGVRVRGDLARCQRCRTARAGRGPDRSGDHPR